MPHVAEHVLEQVLQVLLHVTEHVTEQVLQVLLHVSVHVSDVKHLSQDCPIVTALSYVLLMARLHSFPSQELLGFRFAVGMHPYPNLLSATPFSTIPSSSAA